jgi:hypothetical protein
MHVGMIRGGRTAGLRFLAENAHNPPKTLKGWYFYNKTKNYRMMWAGLREGAKGAVSPSSTPSTPSITYILLPHYSLLITYS